MKGRALALGAVFDNDAKGLTLPEAAAYLGVAQTTIRRYAVKGIIYSSKTYGGHYRFAKSDLDAFIQEQGMSS